MTSPEDKVTDKHIYIGGRSSQLAVVQSETISKYITKEFPYISCSVLALKTFGDTVQGKPLYSFGGKALWTSELEALLLESSEEHHKIDLVVHCLKDMPTTLPDDFEVGCILDRPDPRDALVMKKDSPYKGLDELPAGSVVGTSSVRRSAQIMKHYPHLRFDSVRGSLPTRISKLDAEDSPFECLILAAAGLKRLGLGDRITKCLEKDEMYYAVGQGALALEIKKDNHELKSLLKKIEKTDVAYCCLAERALLRHLEGGCSVPIGVNSNYDLDRKMLTLEGIIVSPNGKYSVEDKMVAVVDSKEGSERVGIDLAEKLISIGGKIILDEVDFTKIANINSRPSSSASNS